MRPLDLILTIVSAALLGWSTTALSTERHWVPQGSSWGLHPDRLLEKCPSFRLKALRDTKSADTRPSLEETESLSLDQDSRLAKRAIVVETSLLVPFSSHIAFDVFSDLPRQKDFSPWLKEVEYLNPPEPGIDHRGKDLGETLWKMKFMGVGFSWKSVVSRLERPHVLEWKSTSGMQNFGKVTFRAVDKDVTHVTLTITFVAPRLIAALFHRSSTLANTVENRIIRTTLINFRDAVQKDISDMNR